MVIGDRRVMVREALPELQQAHAGLVQRAEQLRRHAQLGPNQLSCIELARLADEEEAEAQRVAQAVVALGGAASASPAQTPAAGSLNHWGRLVQDLEGHRAAAKRLREDAFHFAETLPEAAALFEQLCHAEERHALRLRDLIARTDPHALN